MQSPAAVERVFSKELCKSDIPSVVEKILEVKVMWGPVVLATRQLRPGESFTIGDRPDADLRIASASLGEELFPLVCPGGIRGHVISVVQGMQLDLIRNDCTENLPCPYEQGALHSHVLSIGECWKVGMGQLTFLIAYTRPAMGIRSGFFKGIDLGLARWFTAFLLIAVGLWALIQITPTATREISEYIKNPQRFAVSSAFLPNSSKKTFERIEKKIIVDAKLQDPAKWNRAKSKVPGAARELPRETTDEHNRRLVAASDLFKFLKEKGGLGGNGGNANGGSQIQNIDEQLEGLPGPGSPDSGGIGSLRSGSGPPGIGGDGLAPAGTEGYGDNEQITAVNVLVRGKRKITVVRPKKPPTTVVGGLTQQVVGEYLGRHWSKFKYCYEKGLLRDANIYGKVAVTFTIGADGRVEQAEILQASLEDNNVQQCVLRTVRHIRFPKPRGGGEVIVTYPFLFTTSG
jgi:TonB family protein